MSTQTAAFAFQRGYQAALADIQSVAGPEGDWPAVEEWLRNNRTVTEPESVASRGEFHAGDQVEIHYRGQRDRGVVSDATHDEEGHPINDGYVAVEVENGQGTWGFRRGQLTKVD